MAEDRTGKTDRGLVLRLSKQGVSCPQLHCRKRSGGVHLGEGFGGQAGDGGPAMLA